VLNIQILPFIVILFSLIGLFLPKMLKVFYTKKITVNVNIIAHLTRCQ